MSQQVETGVKRYFKAIGDYLRNFFKVSLNKDRSVQ